MLGVIMPCYNPIKAYLPLEYDKEGKRKLIFSENKVNNIIRRSDFAKRQLPNGEYTRLYYSKNLILDSNFINTGEFKGALIQVPCGKCLGCRLAYSRRWAVRSFHEAYMCDNFKNCAFVTLTFNDEMLYKRERPRSLNKLEFSQFMKRLRERIRQEYGITGVRFFCAGEYGSKRGRPHYHVLIYGFNFPDKIEINYKNYPNVDHKLYPRVLKNGTLSTYFISPFLTRCWSPAGSDKPFGFHTISSVNFETSAYVSRYILKKCTKDESKELGREQEFNLCSRMPGLGYSYFEKYYKYFFDKGYIDLGDGRISDIPRYYVDKLEEINPMLHNRYKFANFEKLFYNKIISSADLEQTSERLQAKLELKKMQLDKYDRIYELNSDLHNI